MDEVRALSSLLSDFQRLVVSSQSSKNSDMHSGTSKGKSECEEEEEERTSRTSSCRSAGTLSYFGGSEASSSLTEEKSNYSVHSSSPPSLPVREPSFSCFGCFFFAFHLAHDLSYGTDSTVQWDGIWDDKTPDQLHKTLAKACHPKP